MADRLLGKAEGWKEAAPSAYIICVSILFMNLFGVFQGLLSPGRGSGSGGKFLGFSLVY